MYPYLLLFLIVLVVIYLNKDKFIKQDVDCVGGWDKWESCNAVCDGINTSINGTRKRTYTIKSPAQNNGIKCTNSHGEIQNEVCKKTDCYVDCVGGWDKWESCNAVCNGINTSINGTRKRTYTIKSPAQNNGIKCTNSHGEIQNEVCKKTDCYVDCVGGWDKWESCNAVCDGINTSINGTRERTYTIKSPAQNNGIKCTNSHGEIQNEVCKKTDCYVDCSGNWGDWSSCNAVCDGINTNVNSTRERTYTIKSPAQNNGIKCTNSHGEIQNEQCIKTDCLVDCSGNWGDWSSCEPTCDGRKRTYIITRSAKNNGKICDFIGGATQECNICPSGYTQIVNNGNVSCTLECPNGYSKFNNNKCIKNCNPGETRIGNMCYTDCDLGYNVNNPLFCLAANGLDTKLKNYYIPNSLFLDSSNLNTPVNCPIDCSGNWGEWSSCNVVCTGLSGLVEGIRTRTFNISRQAAKDGTNCTIANNTVGSEICKKYCFLNIRIDAQSDNSYFIIEDKKEIYGVGTNENKRINDSSLNNILLPIKMSINNIKQIYIGNSIIKNMESLFFLKNDGTVFASGSNYYGQLGLGDNNYNNTLQQVKGINGNGILSDIIQIAPSENNTLFLKKDGTVFSCGNNLKGELGIGDYNQRNTLQQVKGIDGNGILSDIIQISAGYEHSLFLRKDGMVFSCGSYDFGQLGIGGDEIIEKTWKTSSFVKQVKGINGIGWISDITQISAGKMHSLFLKGSNGTVFACGYNMNGELGQGFESASLFKTTLQEVKVPYEFANINEKISGITQISAGDIYSLFLRGSDGAVFSCGYNNKGQLGVGDNRNKNRITQVKGVNGIGYISGITQIAAGKNHSLFLRGSDNKIFSCGSNDQGQLGIGNNVDKNSLVEVHITK